jgi:hypothetical protein
MGIAVSLPAGGDPTFGFFYFPTDSIALHVDLGLGIDSLPNATQLFSLQVGPRWYFSHFDRFAPFFQPSLFLANQSPTYGPTNMDVGIEAALGGEFFVTEHFSFGAMTGGALNIAFAPNPANNRSTDVSFKTGTPTAFAAFSW